MLPFAMRWLYSCPEAGYAAVGAIGDTGDIGFERRLTESSSQNQHWNLPDREAASPADRIRYGYAFPHATIFRNIRESLISLSVECLHHGGFRAAGSCQPPARRQRQCSLRQSVLIQHCLIPCISSCVCANRSSAPTAGRSMKFNYINTENGVTIRIDDVAAGQEAAVLETIQHCWRGSMSATPCSSGGCRNIGSMTERIESGSIFLNLTSKPGAQINPSCIAECLRHKLQPSSTHESI
jgi:hypothetical protein